MASRLETDSGLIVLARVPPFRLGAIAVSPPTREVSRAGEVRILEPRIMQALVALAEVEGRVVSRDELVARCWGGRAVGEDAINRVISHLRRLASGFAAGAFQIQTIARVGYRLTAVRDVAADAADASGGAPIANPPPAPGALPKSSAQNLVSRRALIGAAAAIGLPVAGVAWWRFGRARPDPQAIAFAERGMDLLRYGTVEENEQAIAYLREATRLDPRYAGAWGQLALAYAFLQEAQPALEQRVRSVAARALALDGEQPDAQVALILLEPIYGNWAQRGSALRRLLQRNADHSLLIGSYVLFLGEVGRWREAAERLEPMMERMSFAPIAHYRLINAYWSAGRVEDAERALDLAMARWPRHPAIWETKVKLLTYGGRAAAAARYIADTDTHPFDYFNPGDLDRRLAVARAVESRSPADVRSAIEMLIAEVEREPASLPRAVQHIAALGAVGTAYEMLRGYYLAQGRWSAIALRPGQPYSERQTGVLFNPLTAPLRSTPQFETLVRAIGLAAYWRASAMPPDYRRAEMGSPPA